MIQQEYRKIDSKVAKEFYTQLWSYRGRLPDYHKISLEEEVSLTISARKGSESARKFLFERNLRLVPYTIERNCASYCLKIFSQTQFEVGELINEGNFGLWKAIISKNSYNPKKNSGRFIYFAKICIKNKILNYLNKKIIETKREKGIITTHSPEILRAFEVQRYNPNLGDTILPPSLVENPEEIVEALKSLNPPHRKIILESFFNEKTNTQIAKENGVTNQNITQVKKTALKRLEKILRQKIQ